MRLQQEANQKIAELAERAHTEAISYVYIYIYSLVHVPTVSRNVYA